MSQKLHKDERETTINFCEADDEYQIDTSIATHMRKFDRLGYECIGEQLYDDGTPMAKQYRVPKFVVSFRKPVKRKLTEEQRTALSERMKKSKM